MKVSNKLRKCLLVFAAGCGLVASSGAQADNLTITGWAVPGPHPTFQLNAPPISPPAGGFNAVFQSNSFTSYCVDLSQTFSWGSSFAVTPYSAATFFGSTRADAMNRLYTQHFTEVDTITESAAFQLALWEIVQEGTSSYSLTNGNGSFYVVSTASGGSAVSLANTWLSGLASGPTGGYQLTVLHSATKQDQLMPTPIPEPETYAMMLAGLGLLGLAARRRRASGTV